MGILIMGTFQLHESTLIPCMVEISYLVQAYSWQQSHTTQHERFIRHSFQLYKRKICSYTRMQRPFLRTVSQIMIYRCTVPFMRLLMRTTGTYAIL